MRRLLLSTGIGFLFYLTTSISIEQIHLYFDTFGFLYQVDSTLIIAGLYNILLFMVAGYITATVNKTMEQRSAALTGTFITILNFMLIFWSDVRLDSTYELLKVFLPLHMAMLGGTIRKKLKKNS